MPKKKEEAQSKSQKAKPKKWGVSAKEKEEHAERDLFVEEQTTNTIKEEILKMKVITSSVIAQKFNVRISVVKEILRELVEDNKIKTVIQSSRLKVFVPA